MLKLFCCDISDMTEEEFLHMYASCDRCRQQKVDRLKKDHAKKLSVAAGMLARIALAHECGIDPKEISFRRTKNGKPYAEGIDLHFSLSHSHNLAVCAISDKPVGIDAEHLRKAPFAVTKRYFTPKERQYVFGRKGKEQTRFFEVWTKKEAYVKLFGEGVADFPTFDVFDHKKQVYTFWYRDYAVSVAKVK